MIFKKNNIFEIQTISEQQDIIPKNLFFIWIGDSIPNYVNFATQAFKKINPTFNICFNHITIDMIEHRKNQIVDRCCEYIIDAADGKYNKYSIFINRYIKEKRKFCQILANVLRFELLYEYGGIYLDCDTFPIKPFDSLLLKAKSFCPQICSYKNKTVQAETLDDAQLYDFQKEYTPSKYHKYYNNDIFFIGQCKHYKNTIKFSNRTTILNNINTGVYIRNNINDPVFLKLKQKFFDCVLKIGENYCNNNFYIDHFCDRTWQKNNLGIVRSPICKFDYYLKNMNRQFCRKNEYAADCIFSNKEFIFEPADEDYIRQSYSTTINKKLDYAESIIKKINDGVETIHNGIIPKIVYSV